MCKCILLRLFRVLDEIHKSSLFEGLITMNEEVYSVNVITSIRKWCFSRRMKLVPCISHLKSIPFTGEGSEI